MKILTSVIFGMLFSILLTDESAANETTWRWYYTSFMSPSANNVFVRSGTAKIDIKDERITITLDNGRVVGILKKGRINGTLTDFFQHPDEEEFTGELRRTRVKRGCFIEEMFLISDNPNGTVLVLNRFPACAQQ